MMKILSYYILCISLAASLLLSCTKDYFEDDTNLIVYVPELEDKTIDNLHVFLYDENGNLAEHRYLEQPFSELDFMPGTLRFSVMRGDYKLSMMANVNDLGVKMQNHNSIDILSGVLNPFVDGSNIEFAVPNNDYRTMFSKDVFANVLGLPPTRDTVVMDSVRRYTGEVVYKFNGLPSTVDKVKISLGGTATYVTAMGEVGGITNFVVSETNSSDYVVNVNTIEINKFYLPSVNTTPGATSELLVEFYDANSIKIGTIQQQLTTGLNESGASVPFILKSRERLFLEFDGFFLITTQLANWGDIVPGETTPV